MGFFGLRLILMSLFIRKSPYFVKERMLLSTYFIVFHLIKCLSVAYTLAYYTEIYWDSKATIGNFDLSCKCNTNALGTGLLHRSKEFKVFTVYFVLKGDVLKDLKCKKRLERMLCGG